MVSFTIPVKLVSVANLREHWAKRAKRAKLHRRTAFYATPRGISMPVRLTIVRIAPAHRTMDTDNLASACKAVRDGIADRMGIDDKDPRVTWAYQQRVGAAGVLVYVEPVDSPHVMP